MVVHVDPARGRVLHLGEAAVGPGGQNGGAHTLGFEQPDHALHQRVVVGVTNGADRGADALKVEMPSEPSRVVLRPSVRVKRTSAKVGRESNYKSAEFAAALAELGIRRSVRSTRNCYNSTVEVSFFTTSKKERVHGTD